MNQIVLVVNQNLSDLERVVEVTLFDERTGSDNRRTTFPDIF